ncbi:hypothetical protein [Psychromonas arctica]|uniref:hypothetical protein n=1 Tax=Psychromonas arctica TaxID=168275 RepID=UPI002FD4AC3B
MKVVSAGLGILFLPTCVKHLGLNECQFITMQELDMILKLNLYYSAANGPEHVSQFVEF